MSLVFKLILIFLISKNIKIKKGIKIPICFIKKITGNFTWSIMLGFSTPALSNPYVKVINSLLNSQIMCGISKTRKTSIEIKYLKSNFLSFKK